MELENLRERLKLDHLENQLDAVCEQASQRQMNSQDFLVQAWQAEWQGRCQRNVEARLKLARFPWIKTLDQFEFEFQPSLDRKQVRELAGMRFVERTQNVILLGPPGVGKTQLAIALGVKAVAAGYSVLFLPLEQWMTRLRKAFNENRLARTFQQLTDPKVLIMDEIGYLPLSNTEASLVCRLGARRYERASLLITSNKSFLDWAEVFNDPVLAPAVLDRLLHYSTTLNMKGESYRLKEKRQAGLLGRSPAQAEKQVLPEA